MTDQTAKPRPAEGRESRSAYPTRRVAEADTQKPGKEQSPGAAGDAARAPAEPETHDYER